MYVCMYSRGLYSEPVNHQDFYSGTLVLGFWFEMLVFGLISVSLSIAVTEMEKETGL